jgi:uncharacterized protein YhbP (UPF0306 family)
MAREVVQATRERIADFLAAHTTLTLATVGPEHMPAAAAVFYAHDDALTLYFLSEEKTRHAQNILANRVIAGTIQADQQDWRTIRGLQVLGRAERVPVARQAHAITVYTSKFVFVAGLLAGAQGPAPLAGPLAKARFWQLTPEWFRLTDNTIRFGHKEELDLRARSL